MTTQQDHVLTSRLAIDGGEPVRTAPFPSWPVFDEREERLLLEVLHSGKWGEITGDKVTTFAARFAEYQGAKYGICVPNGTMAIQLGLKALGVGPGDEVITTPYTFVATASAALLLGAKPVFVDVRPDTCNLDPERLEAAITPKTKVIVPVHIGGQPVDMDGVLEIAEKHNLRVLEDACQAWGAEWKETRVGALGDLGCFSFQAGKNINAGEGGIVVTNDPELAELCWSLHNVGRVRGGEWYQHEILGWNFRMTEWQGAVLLAQLDRLPEQEPIRERSARYLDRALATIDGVSPIAVDPRVTRHAHHLYPIRYDRSHFGGKTRDEFLDAFKAEGISCASAGYVPLTSSPAIHKTIAEMFGRDSLAQLDTCPIADEVSRDVFWLTQNALLGSEETLDDIVTSIRKIQIAWN
jgi:dTDP-4-amino-4,6-dideoxygalactose transaminase